MLSLVFESKLNLFDNSSTVFSGKLAILDNWSEVTNFIAPITKSSVEKDTFPVLEFMAVTPVVNAGVLNQSVPSNQAKLPDSYAIPPNVPGDVIT